MIQTKQNIPPAPSNNSIPGNGQGMPIPPPPQTIPNSQ